MQMTSVLLADDARMLTFHNQTGVFLNNQAIFLLLPLLLTPSNYPPSLEFRHAPIVVYFLYHLFSFPVLAKTET